MFGLPIRVLRALTREQASDAVLERMKQINAYNPEFLQSDEYTPSMIEFSMRAAIDREHIRNGVDGIEDLTDRQILQILRYLKKHPDEGHYYCDYLSACARLGEYLFGLTPDIPIREAHDRTVERIEINRDRIMQEQFAKAVSSREYRELATCFTQEDEERFEDDPFIVTVPTQIEDLYAESENMHNCVRIYVSRVASKNAQRGTISFYKDKISCLAVAACRNTGSLILFLPFLIYLSCNIKRKQFVTDGNSLSLVNKNIGNGSRLGRMYFSQSIGRFND